MHISINKNTFVVTVRYITIVYKSHFMALHYCLYIFIVSCSLHATDLQFLPFHITRQRIMVDQGGNLNGYGRSKIINLETMIKKKKQC